jgi:hypothetical protein
VQVSGIDGKLVSIIVNVSDEQKRILLWDMKQNVESDSFLVNFDAITIFKDDGAQAAVDGECVQLNYPGGTSSRSFHLENSQSLKSKGVYSLHTGYRMKPDNSQIVLEDFLHFPYSFLTLHLVGIRQ